ncbi:TetR/AcrR family transcriptional regulator [Klenkia taihuensis]|uniref:Transcriptional regulator, TetR family n=1 Tax=Klenkia taihuensis TaxID=1225127 RepID=A0A1I1P3X6_9ACTN|nr:TetR/AcrR family transcriptional regulator [Klenkia taihuensis]GHE11462.1 TetR family transcriptional regulator [Klenkia taihuensis]SFD04641.1 transcriptional regulator, TetR family [Klenkia taihuensis]
MPPTPRVRTGRPRDADLTQRLLDGAVELVAERGYSRLNPEVLAARTGAGKAAIYRRWRTMPALLTDALDGVRLVRTPPDTGSLRGDLAALLHPFTRSPDVLEQAVASVLGLAHHSPELRASLDRALVAPLREAVAAVCEREAGRGRPVAPAQRHLMHRVLQALWWERCGALVPPMPAPEVLALVDRVLLPLVAVR